MATFLDRYRAGERAEVWKELTALGEGVRSEPYFEDAKAVAAETMRRARQNVETLIRRLDGMGYRFLDQVSTAEDQLSRLDQMKELMGVVKGLTPDPWGVGRHVQDLLERSRPWRRRWRRR